MIGRSQVLNATWGILVMSIFFLLVGSLAGYGEILEMNQQAKAITKKADCIKENTNGIKKEFNACKSTGFGDRYCAKIVSELYCKADASDVLQALGIETH